MAVYDIDSGQLHFWCVCFAAYEEVWAEMEGESD